MCIAALGGEGGSVLTSWIVSLARAEGWPVQSTSIPGVAQRTGATTYYVEMLPERWDGPAPPILALTPTPGFVDVVVATELVEAGRAVEQGLVSPERTTMIASSHRAYMIEEKSGMADARIPTERIEKAIEELAARRIVLDMAGLAARAGTIVSSVVFGAVAGAGVLPLPRERFEAVLRESGVAVEANLRGFAMGHDAVTGGATARPESAGNERPEEPGTGLPAEVDALARHGRTRLIEYQGAAYADLYMDRLRRVLEAERETGGATRGWPVTREVARYLALMMSYEDIIRVADLKTRRERWQNIRSANPLEDGDVLNVTEFLKPGIEEAASLMPPRLGGWVIRAARRRDKLDAFNMGLELRTSSVTGFMTMRLLARLRGWRPHSYRFHEETAAIEAWLELVVAATRIDPAFGFEVAECARIRKGYGATHRRGAANFEAIMTRIVRPAIAERSSAAGLVAEMRERALADPEGTSTIEAIESLGSRRPAQDTATKEAER